MIFKSTWPDTDIPTSDLTSYILEGAAARGDKAALIDGPTGRTITYAELAYAVDRIAAGLAARGFGKGDVFAIFSPNIPEYAAAFHGIVRAGGTVTPINPLYTVEEISFQLTNSDARFLVTIPQFLDRANEAAKKVGIEEVFVFGEATEGATAFMDLLTAEGAPPELDVDPENDLVVLPYSSGTTGLPKGVMLSHQNLVSNVAQSLSASTTHENDRIIGVLPFFHIYGLTVILNMALKTGATIVTMPRFDLEEFLTLMQDHKITRAYLVPPIILALAKHPIVDKYDLSSLEVIMSGAAPLGADLSAAAGERLNTVVMQGYGLTETSPVTHMNPDEKGKDRPGSIGYLIPNTTAKIVSTETGDELGTGDRGEVWIKGPQVMKGYLQNEEATAFTIDDDGWLHTGDIGYVDEDGYFFLVDRLKELIKYKGFQVPPAELEAVLISHPAVADAAVIGIPDEEAGELPKAFVVLSQEVDTDEILAYVAEKLSPQKKIRQIEVIDEIPKSAAGKILRRVLKERSPN